VGDDPLTAAPEAAPPDPALVAAARERFVAINGDHPMSPADDAYAREHFVPATGRSLRLMADGLVPQASYVLSDGTPMVPADHLAPLEWAGGAERLRDWFVGHWDAADRADTADTADRMPAEAAWDRYLSGGYVCLRRVEPVAIRAEQRWARQADAAIEALHRDPADHLARGSLGEAVTRLDELLLPMTAYDGLRLAGPSARTRYVERAVRDHLTPAPPYLPIHTERLVLRPAAHGDAADLHAYYSDPEVARHLLQPPFDRGQVEAMLRARVDDDNPFTLEVVAEHEGAVVGDLVLFLRKPAVDTAEIGWVLNPAHSGRGLATEAARALLDVAFGHYRVHRVVAELDARNHRSAALAERLGMALENRAREDYWSKGEWTSSLRYALLAEEWRAARG